MRKALIMWFVISISLGFFIGLFGGWKLLPVSYQEVPPNSLRADYKADYVLMVAEVYHLNNDLGTAITRLETLREVSELFAVQQAVLTARELDYTASDIELLVSLIEAIQTIPANTTPGVIQ